VDREAGTGVLAEILAVIGGTVAVLVAQRHDAAALVRLPQRHEDVAVVAHRDVAGPADAVGKDRGVEAFGHADAGVVVDRARLVQAELRRLGEGGAGKRQRAEHGARKKRVPAEVTGWLARHRASGLPSVAHDPSSCLPARCRSRRFTV
jgi:hypothetical protein